MTHVPEAALKGGGLLIVEIFDSSEKEAVVARVAKAFGAAPEENSEPSEEVVFGRSFATPSRLTWNPTTDQMTLRFRDATRNTDIRIDDSLSYYQTFQLSIIDAPFTPYFLVVLQISLNMLHINTTKLNEILRTASLAPRLFIETLGGLSALVSTMEPHAPFVSWLTVRVGSDHLKRLATHASSLKLHQHASMIETGPDSSLDRLLKEIPFRVDDPTAPLSYLLQTDYLHAMLGQVENAVLSGLRSPFVVFLTDNETISSLPLRGTPGMRLAAQVLPQASPFVPMFAEPNLVASVGLCLWANQRMLSAQRLDKEALALDTLPSTETKSSELIKALSQASVLGMKVAVALKEIGNIDRRTSEALGNLRTGNYASGPEIILFPGTASVREEGAVSSLSRVTQENIALTKSTLLDVEREISSLQRHVSDLAAIQSTRASLKLGRDVRLLTYVLVSLTALLVLIDVVPRVISWIGSMLK